MRFNVNDKREMKFFVRVFRQKCEHCNKWAEPDPTYGHKMKLVNKAYDKILDFYFSDAKKLLQMILGNSKIDEEYYYVFQDARIGIEEILDIPMFAEFDLDASDFLL